MFRQAKQSRVFEDVIEQIQESILDGKLKPGQKLPAERELKELFKISRGTLREALRVLEQKGLLQIKTGVNGGAIIKTVTTHKVIESLDLLIRYQKVSLKDLAEFREEIEGVVAGLAAERADHKSIKTLQQLLAEAQKYLERGVTCWDEFLQVDMKIHMMLAYITGNPVYQSVLETVHENINRYYSKFLPKKEEIMKRNFEDLKGMVEAVKKRQKNKALLRTRQHVNRFYRLMEKNA